MTPEQKLQITDQYRAVVHLAGALASVHQQAASIIPHAPDGVLQIMGERSAHLMEVLGDILNGMDANDEDQDKWLDPIYDRAHEMFPAGAHPEGSAGR